MRKIILYTAISLDGKIAKADGSVDWLEELPNPDQLDYGYANFMQLIDTTLMGNATYEQVRNFDLPWPYPDTANYVFSRDTSLDRDEYVQFVTKDIVPFVQSLKAAEGKAIWLIGGGQINTLFLQHQLIDEIQLFIMPIVLGEGIPLFSAASDLEGMQLTNTEAFSTGVVSLIYKR